MKAARAAVFAAATEELGTSLATIGTAASDTTKLAETVGALAAAASLRGMLNSTYYTPQWHGCSNTRLLKHC
jgi:uncharacterized membrane protein